MLKKRTHQFWIVADFLQLLMYGAKIVDKYNATEKTYSKIETKKEAKNRGSAVPLHVKGYSLKLDALLS